MASLCVRTKFGLILGLGLSNFSFKPSPASLCGIWQAGAMSPTLEVPDVEYRVRGTFLEFRPAGSGSEKMLRSRSAGSIGLSQASPRPKAREDGVDVRSVGIFLSFSAQPAFVCQNRGETRVSENSFCSLGLCESALLGANFLGISAGRSLQFHVFGLGAPCGVHDSSG